MASETVPRTPPVSEANSDTQATDACTEWLMAEVQASIDDPDPGLPHDQAMRKIRAALALPCAPAD